MNQEWDICNDHQLECPWESPEGTPLQTDHFSKTQFPIMHLPGLTTPYTCTALITHTHLHLMF